MFPKGLCIYIFLIILLRILYFGCSIPSVICFLFFPTRSGQRNLSHTLMSRIRRKVWSSGNWPEIVRPVRYFVGCLTSSRVIVLKGTGEEFQDPSRISRLLHHNAFHFELLVCQSLWHKDQVWEDFSRSKIVGVTKILLVPTSRIIGQSYTWIMTKFQHVLSRDGPRRSSQIFKEICLLSCFWFWGACLAAYWMPLHWWY